MLTDKELLWRSGLVLDTILSDNRVRKLSTAIKLVRKNSVARSWTVSQDDDEQLRLHLVNVIKNGHNRAYLSILRNRHGEYVARRKHHKE